MSALDLTVHEQPNRFFIRLPDSDEDAVMTFRQHGNVITIAHTGVPEAFEGHGIASVLMKHVIARARENGWKIIPACSYAAAQFKRHPEWADLLA